MSEDLEARLRAIAAKYDNGNGEADALVAATMRRRDWRLRHGFRVCASCHAEKPVADFGRDASRRDGRAARCRECERTRDARRRVNPTP